MTGRAGKEIVEKFPATPEALEARNRLDSLTVKMKKVEE